MRDIDDFLFFTAETVKFDFCICQEIEASEQSNKSTKKNFSAQNFSWKCSSIFPKPRKCARQHSQTQPLSRREAVSLSRVLVASLPSMEFRYFCFQHELSGADVRKIIFCSHILVFFRAKKWIFCVSKLFGELKPSYSSFLMHFELLNALKSVSKSPKFRFCKHLLSCAQNWSDLQTWKLHFPIPIDTEVNHIAFIQKRFCLLSSWVFEDFIGDPIGDGNRDLPGAEHQNVTVFLQKDLQTVHRSPCSPNIKRLSFRHIQLHLLQPRRTHRLKSILKFSELRRTEITLHTLKCVPEPKNRFRSYHQ